MFLGYFAKTAPRPQFFLTIFLAIPLSTSLSMSANAQSPFDPVDPPNASLPTFAEPQDRITTYVDDEQRVTLHGNRHPLATSQYDTGAVSPIYRMDRMVLTLLPDARQLQALTDLLEEQHDPESPYYHQWLTPNEFADNFGASETDAAQVKKWLESHGMEVEEITAGRRSIVFSGTAAQVESAFHTSIHTYKVGNETHHANTSDPQIPAAFSGVVGGIVSLHDFRAMPMNTGTRLPVTEFTSGGSYYLAPADFATIYDLNPLYQQSIDGTGQSIAVVARSNINLSDVREFRTQFGLPANDPQIIVNGADPGIFSQGEETEGDLDAEWSGAIAKNSAIKFVVSKSTGSTDGSYLSAQYIVTHNLAPVVTMSFGLCEAALGNSGNAFFSGLWQQASAQGMTVFVSSGDSGTAGCDSPSTSRATHGRAVSGLCSTPFSVCVGGTEFHDRAAPSLYWSASNGKADSSALTYIPEVAWNESSSGLWASEGGASTIYVKPTWQTGAGVPADGKRDVPDVSLSAAGHDGYLIYQNGGLYVVGGTSAATPSFAGVMALVVQNRAARQGNANTVFYPLAAKQAAGGASIFHDVTTGNNTVPGQPGYNAAAGYDQVTGLGSIDATILVNHWNDATAAAAFRATASSNAVSLHAGSNNNVIYTIGIAGGFNAAVSFAVSGLPSGVTATFAPGRIAAPGAGSSFLRLNASIKIQSGTYSATVTATSGAKKQTMPLSITCSGRSAMIR